MLCKVIVDLLVRLGGSAHVIDLETRSMTLTEKWNFQKVPLTPFHSRGIDTPCALLSRTCVGAPRIAPNGIGNHPQSSFACADQTLMRKIRIGSIMTSLITTVQLTNDWPERKVGDRARGTMVFQDKFLIVNMLYHTILALENLQMALSST